MLKLNPKKLKLIPALALFIGSALPLVTIAAASSGTTTVPQAQIPRANYWYPASGATVTSGARGKIFQAQNGDLYVMGKGTGLEVLKSGATQFVPAPGTITTNGEFGTIFQARNGDLYVMGTGTRLEVLKYGAARFTLAPGSNIANGREGTIFETKDGSIYTMGNNHRLQVLKPEAKTFVNAPGSITTNGYEGHFFKAKNGDLYVVGWKSQLEVLKAGAKQFVLAPGAQVTNGAGARFLEARNGDLYVMGNKTGLEVLKSGAKQFVAAPGSMTTDGGFGTIFEAQNGDIYVMGTRTGLEVLKSGAKQFQAARGSKTTDGRFGRIFQTRNGNIYVMGNGSGLEMLVNGTTHFKMAPGSRIKTGIFGRFLEAHNGDLYVLAAGARLEVLKVGATEFAVVHSSLVQKGLFAKIFQARDGDIYVMGNKSGLEVLKKGAKAFQPARGSTIRDGKLGRFFQARNGDLYAMGTNSKLEVLRGGKHLRFGVSPEARDGSSDGEIKLTNYSSATSQLQWRKEGTPTWTNVPANGIISGLAAGIYEFQWQTKAGTNYIGISSPTELVADKVLVHLEATIEVPPVPTFSVERVRNEELNDGVIRVTNFAHASSQLQYRRTAADRWIDVPNTGIIDDLIPGHYQFQWKSKNYQLYRDEESLTKLLETKQTVALRSPINAPATPTFITTRETVKGLSDGQIIIRNLAQKYPGLKYRAKGSKDFIAIGSDGVIGNLETSRTQKNYPLLTETKFEFATSAEKNMRAQDFKRTFKPRYATVEYDSEQDVTRYKAILKTFFQDADSKLQYKKRDALKWKNVPASGIIKGLSGGRYQFRWKSIRFKFYSGTSESLTKVLADEQVVAAGNGVLIPPAPRLKSLPEANKNGNDGTIVVTHFKHDHSQLQYKKTDAPTWTNVPPNGIIRNLSPGGYKFQWVTKDSQDRYVGTTSRVQAVQALAVVASYATNALLEQARTRFNDLGTQTVTNQPHPLPNGTISEQKLGDLAGHSKMPAPSPGVTRTYAIHTNAHTGVAKVRVTFTSGDGEAKQVSKTTFYSIKGFKTVAQINQEALQSAIQALESSAFARLAWLKSLGQITKQDALAELYMVLRAKRLSGVQKDLFQVQNMTLSKNLETSLVQITIANHGPNKNFSFKAVKRTDVLTYYIRILRKALQGLPKSVLGNAFPGKKQKLPGLVTKQAVFNHFLKMPVVVELTNDSEEDDNKKALKSAFDLLFTPNNFRLIPNNDAGTLEVIIDDYQTKKELETITGFKKNAAVVTEDKAKFASFTSIALTGSPNQLENGAITETILARLPGHPALPAPTNGVTRSYRIMTSKAGVATVTVTFTAGTTQVEYEYKLTGFKAKTESGSKGLSVGVVAGISAGAIASAVLIIYFFLKRMKKTGKGK